jgi:hypothetical protein
MRVLEAGCIAICSHMVETTIIVNEEESLDYLGMSRLIGEDLLSNGDKSYCSGDKSQLVSS